MSEAQLEQSICQWLTYLGWYCFILKDQASFRDGQHRKTKPFQVKGAADIFAIKNGVNVWIEVKTLVGKQSPSQKEFQKNITDQGGHYWLINSLDSLKLHIKNI